MKIVCLARNSPSSKVCGVEKQQPYLHPQCQPRDSDPRNQSEQQVQQAQQGTARSHLPLALSRAELSSQPHQADGTGEIQGGSMKELQGVEVKWLRESVCY